MILVDTPVWVDHFRNKNATLVEALEEGLVLTHPFVLGELACGNLKNRTCVLEGLDQLPAAIQADHDEVLRLIEQYKLWIRGIGWIDAHLLASALLSNCRLWTLDQVLDRAAGAAAVKRYQDG